MKQNRSSREWLFRIQDILLAIEKIEQYTKNMSSADFKKNQLVIDAVVRNFEVIGEATNGIPANIQKSNPDIPWKQMVTMRNFLIHEYFGVDVNTLWQTAHLHLPKLKKTLESLAKE